MSHLHHSLRLPQTPTGPCVQVWSTHGSVVLNKHLWSHKDRKKSIKRHNLKAAWAYRKRKYEQETICTWEIVSSTWDLLSLWVLLALFSVTFLMLRIGYKLYKPCVELKIWSIISSSLTLPCFQNRGTNIITSILFIWNPWPRDGGRLDWAQRPLCQSSCKHHTCWLPALRLFHCIKLRTV